MYCDSDRKQKCFTDNIYLMECLPIPEEGIDRQYVVMGSTGNLYKVTISYWPSCTCMDYKTRHNRCKHIYFILIRVMHAENENQDFYDYYDLKKLYGNIQEITLNLLPQESVQNSYKNIEKKDINKEVNLCVKPKETKDDVCPICLDEIKMNKGVDYCKYSCGKSIHRECLKMWSKVNNEKCPYCRQSLIKPKYPKPSYINLLTSQANTSNDLVELTNPTETNPTETIPVETIPVETNPVNTNPVETNPLEINPSEINPTKITAIKTIPSETNPEEIMPVETIPAETNQTETNKTEIILSETNSLETIPPKINQAETIPPETNQVETIPSEPNQVETIPPETNQAEKNIKDI